MDCNGVCSPMVFNFTYSLSGSKLTLDYDKTQPIVKCKGYADSRPNQPAKTTVSFTCNTSKLIINGVETYNR